MDLEMDCKILNQNGLYRGKGYCENVQDWFSHLMSVKLDDHNFGDMVFLRSIPGPASTNTPGQFSSIHEDDVGTGLPVKRYMNNAHIAIGGDRLQITKDQAVLLPITNAYWIATEPYADYGYMRGYTKSAIDGADPPNKFYVTVNGEQIKGLENFRFTTSVFTVKIPEAEYGTSMKDYLDVHIPPGDYPALVEGYFVILHKWNVDKNDKTFILHSRAIGPSDSHGSYIAESIYEIQVLSERGVVPPARNTNLINSRLRKAIKDGDLSAQQLQSIVKSLNNTLSDSQLASLSHEFSKLIPNQSYCSERKLAENSERNDEPNIIDDDVESKSEG